MCPPHTCTGCPWRNMWVWEFQSWACPLWISFGTKYLMGMCMCVCIYMSSPGIEPGSLQPQCRILTTVRTRPKAEPIPTTYNHFKPPNVARSLWKFEINPFLRVWPRVSQASKYQEQICHENGNVTLYSA